MEIDLDHAQPRPGPLRSQVCIIGAGIAGLTLAHRLAGQGIDVALLEAGGRALDDRGQGLIAAAHLAGEPHLGTREGRFRAFGGASLRWGGQLLPQLELETGKLEVRKLETERLANSKLDETPPSRWPITASDLHPHYRAAERILAVDDLPYAAAPFFAATHAPAPTLLPQLDARLSKWTPFSRRNLASTLGRDLLGNPNATVYLHAQATELLLAPARDRIEAVLVRTLAGATFRFEAQRFILAAGTVETSRLLLASRSVAPEGVGNARGQVGRNFHDHLTLPAAAVTGPARATLLQQARPWLFARTQHSLKLEASPRLREQRGLNPVLAHITLEEPEDTGLALVREVLTARQRGDLAATLRAHATRLPAAAVEALRLALAAKLHHRRFVSPRAAVTLRLNAAQDAPSQSRITLSSNLDPFHMPQPLVDWRISANEIATLRHFAAHLRDTLAAAGLAAGIEWLPALFDPNQSLTPIEDARHAMGGACMGLDPATSVVDPDLTVHGIANLSIAGPAVFPDGAPQLPTLTLMALTLRLASRLASLPAL